ncbi:MAG TPA: hypothetical protein VFQ27_14500 [Xanthobacteraceae bacterium]|nr:hypothetical protein [Xanthobacteraceae bacterium]
MRGTIFCAAGIAAAIVLADQVVAAVGHDPAPSPQVNRLSKGDREGPALRQPTETVVPKRTGTQEPAASGLPEGCEAAVSPLAKSARNMPAALCLAGLGGGSAAG